MVAAHTLTHKKSIGGFLGVSSRGEKNSKLTGSTLDFVKATATITTAITTAATTTSTATTTAVTTTSFPAHYA